MCCVYRCYGAGVPDSTDRHSSAVGHGITLPLLLRLLLFLPLLLPCRLIISLSLLALSSLSLFSLSRATLRSHHMQSEIMCNLPCSQKTRHQQRMRLLQKRVLCCTPPALQSTVRSLSACFSVEFLYPLYLGKRKTVRDWFEHQHQRRGTLRRQAQW